MTRIILLLLIPLSSFHLLIGQSFTLEGELVNCKSDSIYLFELDGVQLVPFAKVPLTQEEGTYKFTVEINPISTGFYWIGGGQPNNTKMMILGVQTQAKLTGACDNLSQAQIWDSPINNEFALVNNRLQQLQRESSQHISDFRLANRNGSDLATVIEQMAESDQKRKAYLDSLSLAQPFLARVAGLRTYLSYQNNKGEYTSEPDYFAGSFFKFAPLSDPVYDRIPGVYDAFRSYAYTLARLGFSVQHVERYLDKQLAFMPSSSRRYRMALTGIINGLRNNSDDAFVHYSERFIKETAAENSPYRQELAAEIQKIKSRVVGAEAPEINLPTPEGDSLKLSTLRGKIVLIDFWASWCGPCRRENPHVKAMYQKYKDQGFEILGVSLDRDKAAWIQAIEKDGLTWPHVSDLNYFQSVAARTYGVNAIPHTVLLDKEGKIIANKLRGRLLEAKLEELFGEE